ncbi:MAG: pilus assembly protein [Bryobacterales bacterium]|nr:pilus assembly protein [Bryobacterales bacterium]
MRRLSCLSRRGSAMVEFLLGAWLILAIAFGGADFSRVVALKTAVQSAADAGANYASQLTQSAKSCPLLVDTSGVQQAATQDFGTAGSGFTVTATVKCSPTHTDGPFTAAPCACNDAIATYVEVTTSATFNTVGTYPFLPGATTVRAQAIARVQ